MASDFVTEEHGYEERDDSIASLMVYPNWKNYRADSTGRVNELTTHVIRPQVLKLGRGDIDTPVDIKLDCGGEDFQISSLQGIIGRNSQKEWVYNNKSAEKGFYIYKQSGEWIQLKNNTAYLLNENAVLGIGNATPSGTTGDGSFQPAFILALIPFKVNLESYYFELEKEKTYIGRLREKNDISIPATFVSANHLVISKCENGYTLGDLGSTNGTLHKSRILRRAKANLDTIDIFSILNIVFLKIGNIIFFTGAQAFEAGESILTIDIDSVVKNNIRILEKIYGVKIKKGSMVAILGGSGTGKTTLMDCFNGVNTDFNGKVLLEGEDIRKSIKAKYLIGNVPQKNVVHEYLTVYEELWQAARLRRPNDTTKKEIEESIQDVATNCLRLKTNIKRQKVGKLSGGETRRVSVGIELVAGRKILYLDEPDAGVDVYTKRVMFEELREFTKANSKDPLTVISIIHDVSFLDLFDQVIILGKKEYIDKTTGKKGYVGRLVHSGTVNSLNAKLGVNNVVDAFYKIENNIDEIIKD